MRGWWLGLALLAGCDFWTYSGPDPTSGTGYLRFQASEDGTASVVQTPFGNSVRFHARPIDGKPETGFISWFGKDAGANKANPDEGVVIAMAGIFAKREWLCQPIKLETNTMTISMPGSNQIVTTFCPAVGGCDPKLSFVAQVPGLDRRQEILDREMPEAEIYAEDGCAGVQP